MLAKMYDMLGCTLTTIHGVKQALLAKTFLGKIVLSVSLSSFEKDRLDVFQPTIYLKMAMIYVTTVWM